MPRDYKALLALPGVGPATAAGIRAFSFSLPGVYLETNVRSVFIHELFPGVDGVSDKELAPLVERCCPRDGSNPEDDPRSWYYALLDYGACLKRTIPNPSRRSSSHVRQSKFEGSHRQKRAALLRLLLAHGTGAAGGTLEGLTQELSGMEVKAGRAPLSAGDVLALLEELEREGFCHRCGDIWHS